MEPDRADVTDGFHRLYYESADTTWKQTTWLGQPVQKCPLDLWVLQEIVAETRPDLIVECGTYLGGSARFLASVCDELGDGRIVTIDVVERPGRPRHRRIAYLTGSSTTALSSSAFAAIARRAKRVMVILDSDHSRDHVLRELELYSPW